MENYLTPQGLKKIKKELDYLKKVKRKEIAEKLKKSIAFGDLSENAEYQEAKESQSFLEGQILELEQIIKNAVIVSKNEKNNSIVQIGSIVTVSDIGNKGKKEKFELVGSTEAQPIEGKISIESPLGRFLLDQTKGALIEINTPQGKAKYKILKIQ